jgi:hypothetical protein
VYTPNTPKLEDEELGWALTYTRAAEGVVGFTTVGEPPF